MKEIDFLSIADAVSKELLEVFANFEAEEGRAADEGTKGAVKLATVVAITAIKEYHKRLMAILPDDLLGG